jgi:hypothetical protein
VPLIAPQASSAAATILDDLATSLVALSFRASEFFLPAHAWVMSFPDH